MLNAFRHQRMVHFPPGKWLSDRNFGAAFSCIVQALESGVLISEIIDGNAAKYAFAAMPSSPRMVSRDVAFGSRDSVSRIRFSDVDTTSRRIDLDKRRSQAEAWGYALCSLRERDTTACSLRERNTIPVRCAIPRPCDSPRMRRQRVAPGFNLGYPCNREIQGREYGPSGLPMMFLFEQESTFKSDFMPFQEFDVFLLKGSSPMMLRLVLNVFLHRIAIGIADGECAVALLPLEMLF